jgi:hypothetical protein
MRNEEFANIINAARSAIESQRAECRKRLKELSDQQRERPRRGNEDDIFEIESALRALRPAYENLEPALEIDFDSFM